MSAAEAREVRKLAWTGGMRKTYRDTPRAFISCACRSGPSWYCGHGNCGSCHRTEPLRSCETYIVNRDGGVAYLPEDYVHPTDTSAIGPRRTSAAQVWLADRVCRWKCPCACHAPEPAVEQAAPHTEETVPAPARQLTGNWEQPTLL